MNQSDPDTNMDESPTAEFDSPSTAAGNTVGEAPSLADKLADVRVGARTDVKVSRHLFRGEACYILHDPVAFQSHRLSPSDYEVLSSLNPHAPLCENFENLVSRGKVREESLEQFFQFIVRLQALGLLNLPVADGTMLFEKHKAMEARKKGGLLQNLMFWKIPLVNPDAFLDRTMPFMKFFYSKTFFMVWLAMIVGSLFILVQRWHDFMAPMGDILALGNLPYLWFSLIGLKIWHEFGHAYACKKYGGNVPDMGALLFVMTPCAYVDASASWSFPQRWHRLLVSFGGMYFESIAACLALFVWSTTSPGLINSCAHHIVVLSSVITVLFNANPLMRYDGYYIMSDVVGIPNLRARATQEINRLVKRVCLGVRPQGPKVSNGTWLILIVYGIASSIYRTGVILGIAMMVAQKFLLVGLWLGGMQIFNVIMGMYRNSLRFLWRSPEMAGRRTTAVAYSAVLLAGVPALLYFVPLPGGVVARGILSKEVEQVVRADVAGFLEQVHVVPGAKVTSGEPIFGISNPELASKCDVLDAKMGLLRQQVLSQLGTDRAEAARIENGFVQLQEEVAVARREREALTVRSSTDGEMVSGFRDRDAGDFIQRGERLAVVLNGRQVIRGLVTAEELLHSNLIEGEVVKCQFNSQPGIVYGGTVTQLCPAESGLEAFEGLTHLAGGEVVVDPQTMTPLEPYFEFQVLLDDELPDSLGYGSTARVLIDRRAETLANFVVRKSRIFLAQLAKE